MDREPTGFKLIAPPSPEALVPSHDWMPWACAGLGILLLLLLAVILIVRKMKRASVSTADIRATAFREASSALESMTPQSCREAATRCSLVLRNYLAVTANDPALFETHEEFISRQDSLQALTQPARSAAETVFARLATLKYAPAIPDAAPMDVIAECRALLATLHQGFAK